MRGWTIRFCTSADGTRIAYASLEGLRQPAIIGVNSWLRLVEMDKYLPTFRHRRRRRDPDARW